MKTLPAMIGGLILVGCVNGPSILSPDEARLGTDSALDQKFHIAAHYPTGASFNFNGYLVGFEKADRGKVTADGDVDAYLRVDRSAKADDTLPDELDKIVWRLNHNPKEIFPSHIVRYSVEPSGFARVRPCFIYSAYDLHGQAGPCGDGVAKPEGTSELRRGLEAIRTSLKAHILDEVGKAKDSARPYSHILVMSQGWNTSQEESIRNFNTIVASLDNAVPADERGRFKPLVVALSWPSMWGIDFELISYPNKANDADEIGFLGGNILVNDTVASVKGRHPELKIVVIGHSFGARLMSRAAFSGRYLKTRHDVAIDLFVGLQGAFSINRFIPENSWEGAPYRDLAPVGAVVITSSVHDTVNPVAFWSDHAGSSTSHDKACQPKPRDHFSCETVDARGRWLPPSNAAYGKDTVTYVDASALISTNASGTGGKAHSDIYRVEHGCFLWNAIARLDGRKGCAG